MKIAIGAGQPTRNPRRGQEVERGARWRRQGSLRFCSSKSSKSAAEWNHLAGYRVNPAAQAALVLDQRYGFFNYAEPGITSK
ncbi:hypothetical protein KFK09_013313 [Dendrobium nobile]|uniref:Uncharacterized protein n=1 Tax=Dendrobium nobile TaxID=94219 RepID=A0A8T3B987_DENNO|nr:hypothetical protein KFK09_013313 [Dendrobium nobile]